MKTNRKEPLVSVLIGTRDRPESLLRCLDSVLSQTYPEFEILVLDDYSEKHNICYIVNKYVSDGRVKCFRSETQLGVAGGRNFLIKRANGEILVFLDDDAWFDNERCLEKIVNHFSQDPCLGAIAFKIIVYDGYRKDLQVPFSRHARRKWPNLTSQTRLCSYYIGAGHALRKEIIQQCGLYQDNYMFYGEELDLAYRMIQKGFHLLYTPDVIVHHMPQCSVLDKKSDKELYFTVRNRIWFAYKYLPFPYLLIHLLIWLGYYGATAIRNNRLPEFFRGIWTAIAELKGQRRSALTKQTLTYLKTNFGRLWY
jgi:GT2 family glycosyltransferase